MKRLVLEFLLVVFVTGILQVVPSIRISSSTNSAVYAAENDAEMKSEEKNDLDKQRAEEVDKEYQQKIKYIIIIIFAVLFIAGIYWWTYGKLHHKLPRY